MRSIPTTFRASLEDPHNDDPPLVFLTLDHDDFLQPLRFVWDVVDYVLAGETYLGFPFEISLLSDSADAPRGKITVQNVDREIGEAVRGLSGPPSVTIEIYAASDFDLSVAPRVALGTPALVYRASHLYFRQVQVDVLTASGDLTSWDYVNQPWPSKFATQALLPGLFR
jgi:hypothetical protein